MRNRLIAALLTANVALAGLLAWRMTNDSAASAQAQARRPGDFIMVPGESTSLNVGIVYVLNQSDGTLGAIAPNAQNRIEAMRTLRLADVFANALPPEARPADNRNRNRN
jgi:hypothetical protein